MSRAIARLTYSKRTKHGQHQARQTVRVRWKSLLFVYISLVGNGFLSITLPDPLRRVTLGICMDINVQPPAEWTSLEGPYELATHTLSQRSNVLILLNNWLQSDEDKNTSDDERSPSNANEGDCPDGAGPQHSHTHYNDKGDFAWATLNFWAERLRPLWAKPASEDVENSIEKDDPESDGLESNEEEETIIVVCNRTGEENGACLRDR